MAPSKIPFSELQAVDLLEVGPVVVHADRIEAKYRTVTGGVQRSAALTYKYDESVFQPDEPASQNLAALMAAQPALNYGLFCKEIVIHGLLDDHDRQFLEDMARHTAREIYVNRILKPNPFLDPALRESLPGHPKEFLLARVVFDSEKKVCDEGAQTPWGAAT